MNGQLSGRTITCHVLMYSYMHQYHLLRSIYLLSIIMDYRAYQLRVDLTQFKPSATLDCIDQLFSQHLLALVLGKFEQIHTGGARG